MGDSGRDRVGPESVEAGLRAAFGRRRAEPDSVPGALGLDSVLLRDAAGEAPPVLEHAQSAGDAVDDRRYNVVGEIARGGVGIIFKGHDKDLAREVALKVLRPEYAENPDVVERFVEEAQVGGQLQHPGIVPVYGLGLQPDGRPYFAMKLVRGRTLATILRGRKDTQDERRYLLGIFEKICQTMAYAHARGVIHRDLKPSNVMLGAFGEVQVVDWGFAKVLGTEERGRRPRAPDETTVELGEDETIVATVRSGDGSSHSLQGSVMGTPAYMPPEQALGHVDAIDERADVFTLGGILCEILTGEPPYVGQPHERLLMAADGKVEDARQRLESCGADDDLVELAKRCLAPVPGDRPREAGAVAGAIHGHLAAAEERARELELAAAEERANEFEEQARLARQLAQAKEEEARVAAEKRKAERERARQKEERKRAEFERKVRVRSLAMAAALLVAVIVGVGGLLWSQAEAAQRAGEVDTKVSAALQQAGEREGEEKWSEALAAANGALNLARSADAATQDRVRAVVARIRKKKEDAEAAARRSADDEKLLADWLNVVRELSYGATDATLVESFRKYGVDVDDPEAAAARVLASDRRAAIAGVLDTWAYFRRTRAELSGTDWKALARIAKRGDPDELRNRMRDAAIDVDLDALPGIMAEVEAEDPPTQTRVLLGLVLYQFGRTAEAAEVLRTAARVHPDSKEVHAWLGLVLNTIDPPLTREAARHAAALVALRPRNALSRLFAAFLAGDFPLAVRLCDSVLAEDPENVLAMTERATALWHMRDWERAIPALREALHRNPQEIYTWFNLAWALYSTGDLMGALKLARESESILIATPEAQVLQLGAQSLFCGMTGDFEQGVEKAREAVSAAPDNAWAHWCLGTVLRTAGRPEEAAAALRKAIELGSSVEAHLDLAMILRDDDPVAALSHLRRAVALDPLQSESHARLAEFRLWQRADPDRALQSANEALRLDGNNARAWHVLARCHWLKGDMDLFERYARQIKGANPGSAEANLNLVVIAEHRRDHAAALKCAQLALAQADATPDCNGYLACCLMHLGRFAEARKALRRCIDRAPAKGTDNQYRVAFRDRVLERIEVCERVVPFAAKGESIIKGEIAPDGPAQALAFADLCCFADAFERATALYRQASLADRYDRERAAFAAAQAGPEGRAYALELLRAELETLKRHDDAAAVRRVLWDWKRAPLLAPVRNPLPLARLPDAERDGWVPFWDDVEALLRHSLEEE